MDYLRKNGFYSVGNDLRSKLGVNIDYIVMKSVSSFPKISIFTVLPKVATRAESRLPLKVTFTITTSLLLNLRPCFKALISPDKLAVMDSCC